MAKLPSMGSPRRERRVPLDAQVELKFENFRGFLDEIAANISTGGMFVKGTNPPPVGTTVDFSLKLQDDYALIQGRGEVAWVRAHDAGPDAPAGVGIRFLKLQEPSGELIKKIVEKYRDEGGEAFDLERGEPIPASSPEATLEPASVSDLDAALEEEGELEAVDLHRDPEVAEALPPLEATIFTPPEPDAGSTEPEAEAEGGNAGEPSMPVEPVAVPAERPAAVVPAARPVPPPAKPAATLAGDKPPPPRRRAGLRRGNRRPSFLLIFLLLVSALLGAAGYRFTEMLVEWSTGYASEAEEASRVKDIPPPLATRNPSDATGVPAATPEDTAEPGGSDTVGEASAVPSEGDLATPPQGASGTDAEAGTGGTEEDLPPLTQVRLITWRPTEDGPGTHIILRGNGAFDPANLVQARLASRLVLKLRHINWPLRDPVLEVDSPEVSRIRTGFHPKEDGNELHIVLDLAHDDVQLEKIEARDTDVHIFLRP